MTGLHLLAGLDDTDRAVARALLRRGEPVLAVDDRPLLTFGASPARLTLVGESGGAPGDPPRRSGGGS